MCPRIPPRADGGCPIDEALPFRRHAVLNQQHPAISSHARTMHAPCHPRRFTAHNCSSTARALPPCNARGARPVPRGLVWDPIGSYALRYPARRFCEAGWRWPEWARDPRQIHMPLHPEATPAMLGRVVTMLRAPRQRLLSAFHGGMHDCCERVSEAFPIAPVWKAACNAATYARAPGVGDCQANMLTGCAYPATGGDGPCASREASFRDSNQI
jgi:hypothetical protein